MEQTLQQQGEKVLQSLLEIVQNGLDKAPDYVIDFFNRFQLWVLLDSITWIILCGGSAFFMVRRVFKTLKREDIDLLYDDRYTSGVGLFSIVSIVFIGVVAYKIHAILQISIMPELTLIDFLKTYH